MIIVLAPDRQRPLWVKLSSLVNLIFGQQVKVNGPTRSNNPGQTAKSAAQTLEHRASEQSAGQMVKPSLTAQPGKNGPTCMVKLFRLTGRTVKPAGQMVQPSHTVKPVQAVRKAGQNLMVRSGQTAPASWSNGPTLFKLSVKLVQMVRPGQNFRQAGQMVKPCRDF